MILKPFRDPVTGVYNGSLKLREDSESWEMRWKLCLDLVDADNVSHSLNTICLSKLPPSIMPLSKLKLGKVPIVRSCPVSGESHYGKIQGLKPGPVIKKVKRKLCWIG